MTLPPRHGQRLCQPQVSVHVSRGTKVIPRTCFAWIGVAKILINRLYVATSAAEELWGAGTIRASRDWPYGSDVGLDVPVGSPAGVVVGHGSDGQSGVPAVDP